MIRLNAEQARHVAGSLRAYALNQPAAFGYAALSTGRWIGLAVSAILALAAEAGALFALKNAEGEE